MSPITDSEKITKNKSLTRGENSEIRTRVKAIMRITLVN